MSNSIEEWFVIHANGHKHKSRTSSHKLLTLVINHNIKINDQIKSSSCKEEIEKLSCQLKKVERRITQIHSTVTFRYKNSSLSISSVEYSSVLDGTHLIVYLYGKLMYTPNFKFLSSHFPVGKENFIVDADCLGKYSKLQEEIVNVYNC